VFFSSSATNDAMLSAVLRRHLYETDKGSRCDVARTVEQMILRPGYGTDRFGMQIAFCSFAAKLPTMRLNRGSWADGFGLAVHGVMLDDPRGLEDSNDSDEPGNVDRHCQLWDVLTSPRPPRQRTTSKWRPTRSPRSRVGPDGPPMISR